VGAATDPILVTTSASGTLDEGMKSDIQIRSFGTLVMDEPPALGGTDQGPNPMEYVMGALNGCVAVMIRLIAGELDFRFQKVEFQADGVLDLRGLLGAAPVTRHFQTVDFEVRLWTDESAERVTHLQNLVQDRCPAINLLKDAGVDLRTRWVVVSE
jgi:uncharacterized OsmC-like protein